MISAQPLNRAGQGIVVSPSQLLAAVPRFLIVANTTGSARGLRFRPGIPSTGAEGYTTMFEWRLRDRNR